MVYLPRKLFTCSCPQHCICAPPACSSFECVWCTERHDVCVYKKVFVLATSRLPRWDENWVETLRIVKEVFNGRFGPCGRVWTDRALRYRLLQGFHHTAAALALLPLSPKELDSHAYLLGYPSCFYHPFVTLIQALIDRNPIHRPCTDPAHSPFVGFSDYELTTQPKLDMNAWAIWLEWIARMAEWVNGGEDVKIWNDWPLDHIAQPPIPHFRISPIWPSDFPSRDDISAVIWAKDGKAPVAPAGYEVIPIRFYQS